MSLSIAAALAEAKAALFASDSAALDARLLLCHILDCPPAYLHTWPDKTLSLAQQQAYFELIAKRRDGHPVAHLLGYRDFWTLRLAVNNTTLIPRPETELLVEQALALSLPEQARVLDLGTGTGAIALALASERPGWQITGVDRIPAAVALATANQQAHQIPNVTFMHSDWFSAVESHRFDLIVSNPPYVEDNSEYLTQGDVVFEPRSALTAGHDGMDDIRRICAVARDYLSENGVIMFEHGFSQAAAVADCLQIHGYRQIRHFNDLANLPRVTSAIR